MKTIELTRFTRSRIGTLQPGVVGTLLFDDQDLVQIGREIVEIEHANFRIVEDPQEVRMARAATSNNINEQEIEMSAQNSKPATTIRKISPAPKPSQKAKAAASDPLDDLPETTEDASNVVPITKAKVVASKAAAKAPASKKAAPAKAAPKGRHVLTAEERARGGAARAKALKAATPES